MSITVTVRDNETGDTDSARVADGDYLLICAEPCHLEGVQTYASGKTHILTVKGRTPSAGQQALAGEPGLSECAVALRDALLSARNAG